MALRVAVANGNWSNPSTWYLGVKPAAGDVVASNGFTVTIDENINVDSITNSARLPVSIIPIMTSNTTPEGVVSANNFYQNNAAYAFWKAFDGTASGASNHWLTDPVTPPVWLEYQFPTPKTIVAYSLENNFNNLPNSWQFQAWNGSTWVVLDTVSGNTSNSYQIRTFTNTTPYTRYRINITAYNGTNTAIGELRMFDTVADAASAVAGGGFTISSSVSLTFTNTISGGATTLITNTSTSAVSITAPTIFNSASGIYTIQHNGTGTLNITANITGNGGGTAGVLNISSVSIVNVIGTVRNTNYSTAIRLGSAGTLNITGDVGMDSTGGGGATLSIASNNSTINITGNVYGQTLGSNATVTINHGSSSGGSLSIIGNVTAPLATAAANVITTSQANYILIIGTIFAPSVSSNIPVISSSASAINLFSGPFVSGSYGVVPFLCVRMHLIPNAASYFEFRDETTDGAVSPGPIAPATQLVSPTTVGDNPIPANVRFGTVYSLGTLTGTLRMPTANQVTFGVAVDNTFGAAVLTAASVWDYLVANITVENSIGMRLKNVSTPQITGEQLEAFLRLD